MSSLKPSKYIDLQPFQAWVQQSLPAVYDDSLSYTDLLAKMLAYLNNLVANNNALSTDVTNAINYINTFFESTDFQDKVDDKLNRMAEDGSLSKLIQPLFDAYKAQIDQTVATQNTSISNIQSQQTVLEKRMDTFTKFLGGCVTPEMFGAIGDGVTDDTNAIQEMLNYAYEHNSIAPYGVECVVQFNGKQYKTTDTIIHDNITKICVKGNTFIYSSVVDKPAWKIVSSKSSKSSTANKYEKQELYKRGELFGGGGNFCIVASNEQNNNIGLEIGTENSNDIAICTISGISVVGFSVGIKLNSVNTYIITFENIYAEYNTINFWYGGETLLNSNERISFNNSTFGHAHRSVYIKKSTSGLNFINCSFDFNTAIIVIDADNSGEINMTDCHIEGTGYYGPDLPKIVTADNGYFVYVLGSRPYAVLKVNINNCYIHDTQTKNSAEYRIGAENNTKIICNMFQNSFSLTSERFKSVKAICDDNVYLSETYNSESSTSLLMGSLYDKIGKLETISTLTNQDVWEDKTLIEPYKVLGNTWSNWKYYANTLTTPSDKVFAKSLQITIPNEYESTGLDREVECLGNWLKVRIWVKCKNLSKQTGNFFRASVSTFDKSGKKLTSSNNVFYDYPCKENEWTEICFITPTQGASYASVMINLRNDNKVKGDFILGGMIVRPCY